jgi:spermidine/putrescine transport system ATP-binding protein
MVQPLSQTSSNPDLQGVLDIELRKVFKVFDGEAAVRGVDLAIRRGEFFSILGPSGCGKTTLLRLIAGFETPTAGDLLIRKASMVGIPPYRRPVNTVFQSYALFSHLTVEDNIAFGLKIQKMGRAETQARVFEALRLVQLEPLAKRFPSQLSGGQQQRVALARALINRPTVLLLDEPLGALDLKLRKEMQLELKRLHQQLNITFVMVTHDQEEALTMSDRIAVMNGGKLEQVGTPSQIYDRPQSQFVAEFIGETNILSGKIEGSHPSMLWVKSDEGEKIQVQPAMTGHRLLTAGRVAINLRPEKIQLLRSDPRKDGMALEGMNCFEGSLVSTLYLGTHVNCVIRLQSGRNLLVRQPSSETVSKIAGPVYVVWSPQDCLALPVPD